MPQTLTEIKSILAGHGLRPKHRFGQNFLHDANKIRAIIAAANLQSGETVLEVGPGTGTLTEALLEAQARILAVEVDRDLEAILQRFEQSHPRQFSLVIDDVLDSKHAINKRVIESLTAIADEKAAADASSRSFKLIANLPYNVASPLIVNMLVQHPAMSLAIVMIQREVADRLAAQPGSKAYGPLGIITQALAEVTRITTLPPSCFWPAPKVESAVVRIDRRAEPLTDDPEALAGLLQTLFQKRRKQLGTILGRDTALPCGIEPTARPEELTITQLIQLAENRST